MEADYRRAISYNRVICQENVKGQKMLRKAARGNMAIENCWLVIISFDVFLVFQCFFPHIQGSLTCLLAQQATSR